MTGGVLYVLDENDRLDDHLNKWYVKAVDLDGQDKERLKSLIEAHLRHTESPLAEEVHSNFDNRVKFFRKVVPK